MNRSFYTVALLAVFCANSTLIRAEAQNRRQIKRRAAAIVKQMQSTPPVVRPSIFDTVTKSGATKTPVSGTTSLPSSYPGNFSAPYSSSTTTSSVVVTEDDKTKDKERDKDKDKKAARDEKDDKREKGKVRGDAPCMSWVKFGLPVRAVLLCVHGLGLNSNSFAQFGTEMSLKGVAVYAIDVRGFGSWMEAKGHKKIDFEDCISDVKKTLDWLKKANPGKPVFLMGESMGGAIALHAAAEYPDSMNGVISVCSSGDRFKQKKTELKIFLSALTGPTRQINIGKGVVEQAAGDNEAVKAKWEGDELDRMKLSPMELMAFQKFMNESHDAVAKIDRLPVLMVQGTADKLVKPEGTQELYDELKTTDKQIIMVEDAQHLIFENQKVDAAILNDVSKWIFARSPQLDPLSTARAALESGQVQQALALAKGALAKSPNDANANLLMGQVQLKLNRPLLARQHLVKASRLGRGSQVSSDANKYMMMLPQAMIGPKGRAAAAKNPFARPTVLVFNASWCRPCQSMNDVVEQARQRVGTKVDFKIIDVDDEANDALVDQYSIGPVPTTVFLQPDGSVAAFQVGYDDGIDGMLRGVTKILPLPVAPGRRK